MLTRVVQYFVEVERNSDVGEIGLPAFEIECTYFDRFHFVRGSASPK